MIGSRRGARSTRPDHDGWPYFTMEYIEGGSLAQRLTGTPLGAGYAAALVAAMAEAVQVAHQGGIIHRDLKPANILLQRKSECPISNRQSSDANPFRVVPEPLLDFDPKIADFGLARHFDTEPALTLSGARVGTPSYMAPEQALGNTRAIGPAVDIYALGAVLYELLTGRPPFRAETSAEPLGVQPTAGRRHCNLFNRATGARYQANGLIKDRLGAPVAPPHRLPAIFDGNKLLLALTDERFGSPVVWVFVGHVVTHSAERVLGEE